MNKTLVVLAAGMGSRYGGIKQIDPVGPNGEILIEYSIRDAIRSGFDKVVFVIKREIERDFIEFVGAKTARMAKVEYVFQDEGYLPDFYTFPQGRKKMLGTVQAMLCAKDVILEPFIIINADDFYGREAFATISAYLDGIRPGRGAMVAYGLCHTVSKLGAVTRGVCNVRGDMLESVTETYKIMPCADGTIRSFDKSDSGDILPPDTAVSMNFWGFHPSVFESARELFCGFLKGLPPEEMKSEYALPTMVDDMLKNGMIKIDMLYSQADWMGMTYKEDKAQVARGLQALHDAGVY